MQLAFITPTQYLEKFSGQGDILLALAHLIDEAGENEYARFHRNASRSGVRVYLDNGLFEGAQVTTEQLLIRAASIEADVVCAPDVLYDSKGTIKAFKAFARAKQDYGLVAKTMGIPQASNKEDWWDCLHFMNTSPDCDMIGLSILSVPASFKSGLSQYTAERWPITMSRCLMLEQLYSYHRLTPNGVKPCHLLGLGESYADVIMANTLLPDVVVSNDSSSCWIHGHKGIRYSQLGSIPGGKNSEKVQFDAKYGYPMIVGGKEKYDEMMANVQYNIDTAHELKKRRSR